MADKGLSKADRQKKKLGFMTEFQNRLETYPNLLVVHADNVASSQMQQIRKALRGRAVVNMGKNTLMKRAMTDYKENKDGKWNNKENAEKVWPLYDLLKGNVGLIFTKEPLADIRDVIESNKVGAPARQGAISPVRVVVPAGNTGQEPTKTSFFQALNIPTRITRGTVEITTDYLLLEPGQKVGGSEAVLLQMLGIMPFAYGLKIEQVYENGAFYAPAVLDIKEEDLLAKIQEGINDVAGLSLATGLVNEASVPHHVANALKSLLSLSVATDYNFPESEELKGYLADPSKFAVAAPTGATTQEAPKAVAAPVEEEEESEEEMGFGGLF
ncbi:ribosomal protein P0 [Acrasis kona]|uniref:Ribosomal protein P0 n=1 Tax=Acrasis kona TaxID=1008807 RepID=A0AAW2Z3T4_9EUKA